MPGLNGESGRLSSGELVGRGDGLLALPVFLSSTNVLPPLDPPLLSVLDAISLPDFKPCRTRHESVNYGISNY